MDIVLKLMLERGKLYFLFKDNVNAKSNHAHLGTIRSSNLCCEIVQYTAPDEVAVCNLGAVVLSAFALPDGSVDYAGIREATAQLVRNLNHSIDRSFYPLEEARKSNARHRPLGIGIMGFADLLFKLKLPYESDEAREINRCVAENMYYAALHESCMLAKEYGCTYESYPGSPLSKASCSLTSGPARKRR